MFDNSDFHADMDDAVNMGELERVRCLLEQGVDVNVKNASGSTPLLTAAWIGNVPIVKLLLENGADIHATNFQNKTALQIAEDMPFEDVVQVIKEYMASVS